MANMTCPNCDRTISKIATSCPFCGYSIKQITDPRSPNYYHEDQNYISDDKEFLFPDKAVTGQNTVKPQTDSLARMEQPEAGPKKRPSRQPRSGNPGRCLIGYRSGSFLKRWVSMIYHLSATLLIIWSFQQTSAMAKEGLALMHILRTILGGLILFLPAMLLSNTSLRRSLPLLRSRSTAKVVFGMLLFLVPLVLLFSYSCILCK